MVRLLEAAGLLDINAWAAANDPFRASWLWLRKKFAPRGN